MQQLLNEYGSFQQRDPSKNCENDEQGCENLSFSSRASHQIRDNNVPSGYLLHSHGIDGP